MVRSSGRRVWRGLARPIIVVLFFALTAIAAADDSPTLADEEKVQTSAIKPSHHHSSGRSTTIVSASAWEPSFLTSRRSDHAVQSLIAYEGIGRSMNPYLAVM